MLGVHTYIYTQYILTNSKLHHGPGSMDSAGKEKVTKEPAHGPPLQARVAAANRTVLQLANVLYNSRRSWRTWTEQGAKQNN